MTPDEENKTGTPAQARPESSHSDRRAHRPIRGRRGRGRRSGTPRGYVPRQQPRSEAAPGQEPAAGIEPVEEPVQKTLETTSVDAPVAGDAPAVASSFSEPEMREPAAVQSPAYSKFSGGAAERPAVRRAGRGPGSRDFRPAPPEAIQSAIEEVNKILETLRKTVDDMDEVLETLELAERQKDADEREIESLRRSLRQMHHGRDSRS